MLIFLQVHQKYRGGGTVCQYNENIANAYRQTIRNVEDCESEYNLYIN